jgi:hypothetical protein
MIDIKCHVCGPKLAGLIRETENSEYICSDCLFSQLRKTEEMLLEATEWNWLSDDADITIPKDLIDFVRTIQRKPK